MVKALEKEGIPARRVPLSGALGGLDGGDLRIGPNRDYRAEVKSRANGEGFAVMEGWLAGNDVLICKRDRCDPFVAMDWATFIDLLKVRFFGEI